MNVHCSIISCNELVGSISMAYKFSNPFTCVASFENFWPNASERLCAGSVDCVIVSGLHSVRGWGKGKRTMSRTDSRHDASWIAGEQDVVVFPVSSSDTILFTRASEHTNTTLTTWTKFVPISNWKGYEMINTCHKISTSTTFGPRCFVKSVLTMLQPFLRYFDALINGWVVKSRNRV